MNPGIDSRVSEAGVPTHLTASTIVNAAGAGNLLGIWVSSASATPTLAVYNGTTAGGVVMANTFTPSAGTFYPMPMQFDAGLYVAIVGTVDCTVITTPLK